MRAGRAHRVRASVSKVCAYLMLEQLVHPRAQVALVMRASNLSGPFTDIILVGVQPAHAQHGGQRANARYLTARARVHTWHLRRRWRGSAPLNVGLLNAFGVLEGVAGVSGFTMSFTMSFTGDTVKLRVGTVWGANEPDAFKCQGVQVSKTAASARRGRHAPHARSCSAHSHSDHDATYAQAAQQRS